MFFLSRLTARVSLMLCCYAWSNKFHNFSYFLWFSRLARLSPVRGSWDRARVAMLGPTKRRRRVGAAGGRRQCGPATRPLSTEERGLKGWKGGFEGEGCDNSEWCGGIEEGVLEGRSRRRRNRFIKRAQPPPLPPPAPPAPARTLLHQNALTDCTLAINSFLSCN